MKRWFAPADLYLSAVVCLLIGADLVSSVRFRHGLARMAGHLAYLLSRRKLQNKLQGLRLNFSHLEGTQIKRLARGSFHSFWEELFELATPRSQREQLRQIPVIGIEHLEEALSQGKGAILWESSAFGLRTPAKKVLAARGIPLSQVHAEFHLAGLTGLGPPTLFRKKVIKPLIERFERRFVTEIIDIPLSDSLKHTRVILGRLQHNGVVCSAADGSLGQRKLHFDFLNRSVAFPTGIASLARHSGTPIFPLLCPRAADGRPQVHIHPPLSSHGSRDRESNMRAVLGEFVRLLESSALAHPGQYRAWHTIGAAPDRNP